MSKKNIFCQRFGCGKHVTGKSKYCSSDCRIKAVSLKMIAYSKEMKAKYGKSYYVTGIPKNAKKENCSVK